MNPLVCYDQMFRAWQELVAYPAILVFERLNRPWLSALMALAVDAPAADEG